MDSEALEDLAELQRLRGFSSRPNVQKCLDAKIAALLAAQQHATATPSTPLAPGNGVPSSHPAPSQHSLLPTIKLTTYAWDQSDKFVKLYVTVPGVEAVSEQNIVLNFTDRSFSLSVKDAAGKNYEMTMKGLLNAIDPQKSHAKQKKDTVLVMLKKAKENTTWETVTATEKSSKDSRTPKFDKNADPQDSLMTMMKQMYDEGDDEMKRTIRKSWHEAQAKKGAGMGDEMMPSSSMGLDEM